MGRIYKWKDDQGKIHFTDDTSRIPLKYRMQLTKFKGVVEPSKGKFSASAAPETGSDEAAAGEETPPAGGGQAPTLPPKFKYTQGPQGGGTDTARTTFPLSGAAEAKKDIGSFTASTTQATTLLLSFAQALTLTDSPPITVTANGQIIENVHIVANGEPAIVIRSFSGVIIRNVEIQHQGASGILCLSAPTLTITNVSITHTGTAPPGLFPQARIK